MTLVETAQRADQIEDTVGGYLELVTGQYCRARKFAPAVLGAFDFRASTETESLLAGVDVLADLYDRRENYRLMPRLGSSRSGRNTSGTRTVESTATAGKCAC